MSFIRPVVSFLFSGSFLGGLMSGLLLGAGGLFLFARVYMSVAGGPPSTKKPYLTPPDLPAQEKQSDVGTVPSEWPLYSIEGDSTTMGALNDRPVLLTVGATWCDPCTAELPTLQALHDTIGRSAQVVFVSPEPQDSVRHHSDSKGLSMPVYTTATLPPILQGDTLPRSYVLRPGGQVAFRRIGPADWNTPSIRQRLKRLDSTSASPSPPANRDTGS